MYNLQVSAHLQSYELLRLIKNMMEDHKNRLSEQVASAQEAKEDESNHPLPAVPSDTESGADTDEHPEGRLIRDEELAITLAVEEKQIAEEWAAEQEARKKEQEAVNEKLQQILRMPENAPEPGPSSKANRTEHESSSDDDEARC